MQISAPHMQQVAQAMMPVALQTPQPQARAVDAGAGNVASTRADSDAVQRQDGHRPFSELAAVRQAVAAPTTQVGASIAARSGPAGQPVGNAVFATAFDRSPSQIPVGRSSAPASASPQLSRALSEYGAMRSMR